MTATIIPFVPRNAADRKPMLEQMAHEIVEQVTEPKCHDDLMGNSVLDYTALQYGWQDGDPA